MKGEIYSPGDGNHAPMTKGEELADLRARLEQAERERDEQRREWHEEYRIQNDRIVELLTENRLLREALEKATNACRYRADDRYDTCEDNCTVGHRYQEQCPIYLPTVEPSPTTAKAERVKRLERIEAAASEALAIMAPNPPEPWPNYAAATSVLRAALAGEEPTKGGRT